VKSVYWGDPVKIPESDLPAFVVMPISSDYTRRGSRYDQKLHTVEIRLVYNMRSYAQSGSIVDDVRKVNSIEQAMRIVEQTSGTTMGTQIDTLCGLIQANPTLTFLPKLSETSQVASVDSKVRRVNYVFNSARGFPTFEVIVSIETRAIGDRATNP
jgi:hypothetical protein